MRTSSGTFTLEWNNGLRSYSGTYAECIAEVRESYPVIYIHHDDDRVLVYDESEGEAVAGFEIAEIYPA